MEIKENSGIVIDNAEMFKKIQEKLFELEYIWNIGKVVNTRSFEALTIYPENKRIYYCEKKWIFNRDRLKIITPLDLGILPDKWYINRNENNYKIVNDYFNNIDLFNINYDSKSGRIRNDGSLFDFEECTELTTEQFKTLVIKESTIEESTEEYYYRFKTEQEFKKDNLWCNIGPKNWSKRMLPLLGKTIDKKYYVDCIKQKSFYYKNNHYIEYIHCYSYVKEYNMPVSSVEEFSKLNLQTNKTNNNGKTIKVSRLPTIIFRRERERGIIIHSKHKETTIRNGYFRNKKSY